MSVRTGNFAAPRSTSTTVRISAGCLHARYSTARSNGGPRLYHVIHHQQRVAREVEGGVGRIFRQPGFRVEQRESVRVALDLQSSRTPAREAVGFSSRACSRVGEPVRRAAGCRQSQSASARSADPAAWRAMSLTMRRVVRAVEAGAPASGLSVMVAPCMRGSEGCSCRRFGNLVGPGHRVISAAVRSTATKGSHCTSKEARGSGRGARRFRPVGARCPIRLPGAAGLLQGDRRFVR